MLSFCTLTKTSAIIIHYITKTISTLLELESSEILSSTNEISSLHRWSELFTRFYFFFFFFFFYYRENGII